MRKTVLISGGSTGIGKACVEAFARAGYSVVFLYHTHETAAKRLTEDLRGAGLDASCYGCDVSSPDSVSSVISDILRSYHHIDVLINNAGIALTGVITELSAADWDRLFDTDVRSVFLLSRALLPGMIARQTGSIINISSVWGETGASCETAYSAAKAALIGLTKAMAKELGPSGIRVNCVAPGVIDTAMNSALDPAELKALAEQTPLGRLGTPEDVASAVLFLAGDGASFITGHTLSVGGGFAL